MDGRWGALVAAGAGAASVALLLGAAVAAISPGWGLADTAYKRGIPSGFDVAYGFDLRSWSRLRGSAVMA